MSAVLHTARLELMPMSMPMVEAVLLGRREAAESLAHARMPERWPNRELIERAFSISLESLQAKPEARLWGARVMIWRREGAERRVVGSVVFRGEPEHGASEIAYGVEEASQGQGIATEGVGACVAWALEQPGVDAVQAATFAWHRASVRVLEKVGMVCSGTREHDMMGEMLVYERRRRVV